MASPSTPASWYPDPSGAPGQRYFDGEKWTEHYAGLTEAQRSAILDEAINEHLVHGAHIQSRTATQATLKYGEEPNAAIHLLIALLTCGIWIIAYIIIASSNHVQYRTLRVEQDGTVRTLDIYGNEISPPSAARR